MKSLKHLNKYLWKYKFRLILGIVFVVVSNIFGIYPAQIIREAINTIASSDEMAQYLEKEDGKVVEYESQIEFITNFTGIYTLGERILFFAFLVIALALVKGLFTFFMRQTIIIMSRLIEYDLKNEIYKHYQELSLSFYKKNNTGDIMNRISEDVTRVRMYLGPGIMYTINLIALFTLVIGVMLNTDVELTLYALAPLPVLSVLIYYVSNKINKKSESVQEQLSMLSTLSQESFSGIRIIKSFVKERYMNKTLDKTAEGYKDKTLDLVKLEAFFFPIMLMLIGLSTILTVYIGGMKVIKGEISPGTIAEFIIYVNLLTWPVAALGWVTSLVQRAAASQKRINEFLNSETEIKNTNNRPSDIKGEIVFKNVSFIYPDSGIKALKNINFKISPGETLAIIGKTGSGKSTIADLICRLFDASEGEVKVDGINIKDANLNSLRSSIGYVPQEVFLFSDSIKNNISFGITDGSVDQEAIERAAKEAAIYSNIEGFPKKFETELGERGITLSGGQKQRISIARAIINRPNILIFDDCLSAVDTETEETILNNLKEIMVQKTAVIISHRISSVKHANKILVMNDGEIAEHGSHDELIKLEGLYYETYQRQLLEEQEQENF